jgi:flagellar hook-associated protein 2
MAVDYLSALNVGSGLNVTQIVDALVDAEKTPRENTINEKIAEKTVSISAFAEVKQQFSTLQTSLNSLAQASTLNVQATSSDGNPSSVGVTLTNASLVEPFDHNITITSLATPQSIAFSGYATSSSILDATNLSIQLGSWATDNSGNKTFTANTDFTQQSLVLDGADNLTTLKNRINALDVGISASIVRVADNNYALTLSSPLGTNNQIRVQATSNSGGISNLSYDPETNGSGAANGGDALKEISAASDAVISFNGLSVTRETNVINDIIPGVTLTLNATTSSNQKVSARHDPNLSMDATKLFVETMNTITNGLMTLNKNSLDEEERGALAGDTLVRSLRYKLRQMTTTPIVGFGADSIYLSNFGVMTNRDGTLSLNETKFKSYFTENPKEFTALSKSHVTSTNVAVEAEMTGKEWTPGTYEFLSLINTATSVISADESRNQTFKSIDSSFGSDDGQLSDNLQAYVADHPNGSWSLSGTDSSHLTIDANGVVTITGGTDREVKPSYSFNVEYTVTDNALPSSFRTFTEAVTFNVNDLAERTFTLSTPSVPATVYAGDTFTIAVDGQTVTTAAIGVGGDTSYNVDKLAAAFNSANANLVTPADGVFSGSGSNLIFKYNDSATPQTTTMSAGLTYSPATPLGTVDQQRNGALTNRTVYFNESSNDISNSILTASQGDIFKVDVQDGSGTVSVSHTVTSADVTAISNLTTATQRINYLAGKLDTAANTADAGSDVGYGFSNTAGTQQVEKITNPTVPSISAGDKFKVTINGTEIETAAATTQSSLSDIVDMLNSANAAPLVPGTFSVSNNDILFTYTNSEPVAGTIGSLFFLDASSGTTYDSGTGSAGQDTAGDVSTQQVERITTPTVPSIAPGDKFKVTINGTEIETAAATSQSSLSDIVNMLNTANAGSTVPGTFSVDNTNDIIFTYTSNGAVGGTISKLFFLDSSVGISYGAGTGSGAQDTAGADGKLTVTCNTGGTADNGDTIGQLQLSTDSGGSYSTLGASLQNSAGTSTTEIVRIGSPSLPTIKTGDKFSIQIDNNGSPFTVTTSTLSDNDTLTDVANALNTAHGGSVGTFSVSSANLLFTFNDTNAGNISNGQDAGLVYIPHPGTIALTATAVDHVHLTTVTEDSHTAGPTVAALDGTLMSLENELFKLTSTGAKGIWVKADGNHTSTLYVGKSLFDTINEFGDTVLISDGDIDKRVKRYSEDISDQKDQLTSLETRMENERARYMSQFTAMESAVSGFKETQSLLTNMMDAWTAGMKN